MMKLRTLAAGLMGLTFAATASAAGGAKSPKPPEGGWPFEGPLGKFEEDSVQRGFQVYNEVCAACHGLKLLSYRNLGEKGGPFYDPDFPNANDNPLVKAFAAEKQVAFIDENGDEDFREAKPSDSFKDPYPNPQKAAALNNGAAPPDLSVITKARHGGASYIYNLLKGYPDPEKYKAREVQRMVAFTNPDTGIYEPYAVTDVKFTMDDGHGHEGILTQTPNQYYNPYMPGDTSGAWDGDPRHAPYGGFLAMKPPLVEPAGDAGVDCKALHKTAKEKIKEAEHPEGGEHIELSGPAKMAIMDEYLYNECTAQVVYMDGTYPSVKQMSYDVAQFLAWAGEPKQVNRKSLGLPVLIYLLLLCGLLYASYKQIWKKVDH